MIDKPELPQRPFKSMYGRAEWRDLDYKWHEESLKICFKYIAKLEAELALEEIGRAGAEMALSLKNADLNLVLKTIAE